MREGCTWCDFDACHEALMLLLKRIKELLRIHNGRGLTDAERAKMANLHLSVDRCIERAGDILQHLQLCTQWIQTVDDAQIRLILTLRYVDGLPWDRIQASMPCGLTDRSGDTAMKRVRRFSKTLPKQDDFVYVFPDELCTAMVPCDIAHAVNQQRSIIRVSAYEEGCYDE